MVNKPEWMNKMLPIPELVVELKKELQDLFLTKTLDGWIADAENHDICLSPILDIDEVEKDKHLSERDMFIEMEHADYGKFKSVNQPFKFSETPAMLSEETIVPSYSSSLLN